MSDNSSPHVAKNPHWKGPRTIKMSKLLNDKKAHDGRVSLDTTGENFEDVGEEPLSVQGEESISGTEPSPDSDDDLLANAQAVGEQMDEDSEHPEEVDIARDIDAAERDIKEG